MWQCLVLIAIHTYVTIGLETKAALVVSAIRVMTNRRAICHYLQIHFHQHNIKCDIGLLKCNIKMIVWISKLYKSVLEPISMYCLNDHARLWTTNLQNRSYKDHMKSRHLYTYMCKLFAKWKKKTFQKLINPFKWINKQLTSLDARWQSWRSSQPSRIKTPCSTVDWENN